MRTALVDTNLRCNQACTYCTARRPRDDLAAIQPAALAARIDAALAAGAREILLGGGEPTLHRGLEALVARARAGGAAVVLATNATLLDGARARALRDAGLTLARVNLAGWGDALDAVTRDPGGFARTVAGLEALAAAGLPIELEAAVVRATAPRLPALPRQVRAAFGTAVGGLSLVVPVESPAPEELLPLGAAAAVLREVDDAARSAALPLKLSPGSPPPPCVLPDPARLASLYALTPGGAERPGHRRLQSCPDCLVADRCPGVPAPALERFGAPAATPVLDPRLRRRLALIGSVEAQVARELVTQNRLVDPVHGERLEDIIRVNFHCNQACRFCFVSTHLPTAPEAQVRAAIEAAAHAGRAISLSGGEPTLHPHLPELVALARRGSPLVSLQTNAVRLAEPGLAQALRDAGLQEAFVSLHAAEAGVSDRITGAPGTFERTCAGIDALVGLGLTVRLSFVICRSNLGQLVPVVQLAAARWPGADVNFSFVAASTDVVPRDPELIPRYADVLPALGEAMGEGARLGVRVGGFESMCGLPLCLVPGSPARYLDLPHIPRGFDRGEFADAEPCQRCDLHGRCYGLRRSYAELHGASELRPVRAADLRP